MKLGAWPVTGTDAFRFAVPPDNSDKMAASRVKKREKYSNVITIYLVTLRSPFGK